MKIEVVRNEKSDRTLSQGAIKVLKAISDTEGACNYYAKPKILEGALATLRVLDENSMADELETLFGELDTPDVSHIHINLEQ